MYNMREHRIESQDNRLSDSKDLEYCKSITRRSEENEPNQSEKQKTVLGEELEICCSSDSRPANFGEPKPLPRSYPIVALKPVFSFPHPNAPPEVMSLKAFGFL